MYRMLIVDDEKNERDCILYLLKNFYFTKSHICLI